MVLAPRGSPSFAEAQSTSSGTITVGPTHIQPSPVAAGTRSSPSAGMRLSPTAAGISPSPAGSDGLAVGVVAELCSVLAVEEGRQGGPGRRIRRSNHARFRDAEAGITRRDHEREESKSTSGEEFGGGCDRRPGGVGAAAGMADIAISPPKPHRWPRAQSGPATEPSFCGRVARALDALERTARGGHPPREQRTRLRGRSLPTPVATSAARRRGDPQDESR